MEVTATAKNIRISAKKVRLVVDQIKKMDPQTALSILELTVKSASMPLQKVIKSAIANAKNNLGLDEQSLKFKAVLVGQGPPFKRFRPVSRGRAHAILKRTSHITVILEGEQRAKESKVTKEPEEPKEKNAK